MQPMRRNDMGIPNPPPMLIIGSLGLGFLTVIFRRPMTFLRPFFGGRLSLTKIDET